MTPGARVFAGRLRAALLTGRRRSILRGAGAPMPRRSDGYEFAELRAYVEGDDPRRIDWAATARAGEMQTRVVFEDHALTLVSAVDSSASMFVGRTRSNYDLALDAASVWYGAAIDDDRCARVERDGLLFPRTMRGRAAALVCAGGRAARASTFCEVVRTALATVPRDSQMLLASDFFEADEVLPLVGACAARFDTTVLFVRDPWASGLSLGGFVRLRDAETGHVARVFVGARQRASFREAVARREAEVIARLSALNVRVGTLDERGAETALAEAFAL